MSTTPALREPQPATTVSSDGFGQKASKIGALFGQRASAKVLLIGADWREWDHDLAAYFVHVTHVQSPAELAVALSAAARYDLVLLTHDALCGLSGGARRRLTALVRRALAPRGTLLLFAENRLSLREVARDPARLVSHHAMTCWGYRALLASAGFERHDEFVPLPHVWSAEECIRPDGIEIVLPSHASSLERGLSLARLYHVVHDGYLYVASGEYGGTQPFLVELAGALRAVGCITAPLELDRFDLRGRGSLVVVVRDEGSHRRLVCRVTTNEETDVRVRRNAAWTSRVLALPALPRSVAHHIPASVATVRLDCGTAYVEEHVDGSIGWKLAGRPRYEPTMFGGVYAFVRDFNRATARAVDVDEATFQRLARGPDVSWLDDETTRLLVRLEHGLRARTVGRRRHLVLAHGDFGYGNVIADARSGTLKGVIDWDQAREDWAGVDLINFLVQRIASMRALGISDAFRACGAHVIGGELRALDDRIDYRELFPDDLRDGAALVAWVALRFAQRGMAYPALFVTTRDDTHALLRWACEIVE